MGVLHLDSLKTKNRNLVFVFIGLSVVAVVLIVAIVVVNLKRNGVFSCEGYADEYEMISCLSREEPGEELNKRYDAVLEKAIKDENYDLFDNVVMDRAVNLSEGDSCETSMSFLDSVEGKYVASLPLLDQFGFYSTGLTQARECDDLAKEAYYEKKYNEIMESDEYEAAVAEDDYRVYGVDIFEDGEEELIEEEEEEEDEE